MKKNFLMMIAVVMLAAVSTVFYSCGNSSTADKGTSKESSENDGDKNTISFKMNLNGEEMEADLDNLSDEFDRNLDELDKEMDKNLDEMDKEFDKAFGDDE